MDLSIIVPLYNTGDYIGRCLDSLLDQDIPKVDYEIIVINDGSQDDGVKVVEKYVKKYPNVKLYSQNNQGLYKTRNRGIKLAQGKYIYLIDSDDFIASNCLREIIEVMKKEDLDFFGFGIMATSSSTIDSDFDPATDFDSLAVCDGITYIENYNFRNEAVWFIINKEYLRSLDHFFMDGHGLEDGVFTVEVLYRARRAASIKTKLYAYFQRPESTMHTKSRKRIRFLLKGYEILADEYEKFYKKVSKEGLLNEKGLQRIKNRQQSYVFFLLIRAVRFNLSYKEIGAIIAELKSKSFYPIKNFIGPDYNKFVYRVLVVVLNNKTALFISAFFYRLIKKIFPV